MDYDFTTISHKENHCKYIKIWDLVQNTFLVESQLFEIKARFDNNSSQVYLRSIYFNHDLWS